MYISTYIKSNVTHYTDTDADGKMCRLLMQKWCHDNNIHLESIFPDCRTVIDKPRFSTVLMTDWTPNNIEAFLEENPHVERCIIVDHHIMAEIQSAKIVKFVDMNKCSANILCGALGIKNTHVIKFISYLQMQDLFKGPSGKPLPEESIQTRATVAKCCDAVRTAVGKRGGYHGLFQLINPAFFKFIQKEMATIIENDAFVEKMLESPYVYNKKDFWVFDNVRNWKENPEERQIYSRNMSLIGYKLCRKFGKAGFFINIKIFPNGSVYGLGIRSATNCATTAQQLMEHIINISENEPIPKGAYRTAGGHEMACGIHGYGKSAYNMWLGLQ